MSCPDVGTLRAYADRELPARQADVVARHLGGCEDCRARLGEMERVASFASARLARLAPSGSDRPVEARVALAGLRQRTAVPSGVGARLAAAFAGISQILSPARLAGAVVSIALVALLLVAPDGLRAQGLLGIFRANEVVAVQIDPAALVDFPEPEDLGTATMSSEPEIKLTTLAEAGRQAGITPRTLTSVPAGFAKDAMVLVTTPVEGSYTYDLKKVEAYYRQRGLTSKPPAELGGLTVRGSLSPVVLQVFADQAALDQMKSAAKAAPEQMDPVASKSKMLVFAQVSSPKLQVSDGVDVAALRQKLLASGAFPEELALQLQAIENWQETMPVPVMKGTSRDVTVDGVKGVLSIDPEGRGSWLIWLKDGVVYGLGGSVTESVLLDAAKSLSK